MRWAIRPTRWGLSLFRDGELVASCDPKLLPEMIGLVCRFNQCRDPLGAVSERNWS